MLRLLGSTLVAAAFLIAPAFAETDWGAYGDLSSVRCEDAKTIADIMESARGLKFANGKYVFATLNGIKIIGSKTVQATRDKLVCHLRVKYIQGGTYHTISGRHTVQLLSDGKWRTKFQPNS